MKRLSKLNYSVRVQLEIPGGADQERIEMTEFDSAFLCGLLDKFRPKKILEVGVAAGGTTAIILKALENRTDDIEMFSCDLSENYYRKSDSGLRTGYMADKEIKKSKVKHTFLLGKYLPEFLDLIGNDIDFLILDTVHYLPGEVLDFLAAMPYLKEDAIVVLHDILYNLSELQNRKGMATTILFSAVAGEKYFNFLSKEDSLRCSYPNIGAFRVNNDTRKYIENVFLALMAEWSYLPDREEMEIYRNIYRRHYSRRLNKIFGLSFVLHKKQFAEHISFKKMFHENLVETKKWLKKELQYRHLVKK